MVREFIGAIRVGDVNLDHDEVRCVLESEWLYVLVLDYGAVVRRQIRGKSGESKRREERVFDWAPVGIGRLS